MRFLVMMTAAGLAGCAAVPVSEPMAEAAGVSPYDSAYTDLDLDACTVLEVFEEGGGAAFECRGYQDIPVYVTEGDLRFDVDVGVKNDRFDTPPAFNTLGDKIEWRMKNGEPFAVIVRYLLDDGGMDELPKGASWLAAIKIGTETASGCTAGYVNALAPSQR